MGTSGLSEVAYNDSNLLVLSKHRRHLSKQSTLDKPVGIHNGPRLGHGYQKPPVGEYKEVQRAQVHTGTEVYDYEIGIQGIQVLYQLNL
ncbi:hypothetical protein MBAV_003097 [Candidatus Magnetobacterium bavaricum]|uniref:Uncharacterized protein n=1 Tax=Candidatus Magnetobacterium bavaricum TaxID=29290 RepID=A0A0F3GRY1_9BACT|nr:hypothetical protein MBAV_003097 [Candidatus Magnetobacterium bavaricum]